MFRLSLIVVLAATVLSACGAGAPVSDAEDVIEVHVYKSPFCGCCGEWVKYMEDQGFEVTVQEVSDMALIKARYEVPPRLESCHTAIVDGYVVEGHVPAREIYRMLAERPAILGIAVAGMPAGSPGMNGSPQPFDVTAFDQDGEMLPFASYPDN